MPSENSIKSEEIPQKSSMEILSELFGSFDAEPPVIVKKEKSEDHKKHKKAKKKHKHKEKKHKSKKSKKRKRSGSESCSEDSAVDITDILVKKEPDLDKKVKREKIDEESSIYDATILAIKEKEMIKSEDSKSKSKDSKTEKTKSSDRNHRYRSKSKDRHHHHHHYQSKSRDNSKSKSESRRRSRDRSRSSRHATRDYEKRRSRDARPRESHRASRPFREKDHRETASVSSGRIDKKKLLEIARRNAIQMMKSGNLPGALNLGPQAQEKVIAAIKSGGKTVEELTDFCKTLSRKEELGELSSVSDDNDSDSDSDKQFHHPFLIKERPVSITMNIKNSVPLPIKNSQERASELRIQFPVSSGQQHRKTENEWVPVAPKKPTDPPSVINGSPAPPTVTIPNVTTVAIVKQPPKAIMPPPEPKVNEETSLEKVEEAITAESVFPAAPKEQNVDIASIVSQRLLAMRKLQENPNNVQALNTIYKAQKEMNNWAESKQPIGQFTGSTGVQILSQAELSSGYQAWARKDQLQTAAPVSGGMGMHLLQKMGWKPGEGLGKEKTGTLEPLLLEVKLDKKGIVARSEEHLKGAGKRAKSAKGGGGGGAPAVAPAAAVGCGGGPVQAFQGKHPVSLLGEYASKNKLGVPGYELCFECGPDHKKNFLFKVILNNIEYKPQVASPTKKEAKANAALVCLQHLGLFPMPQPAAPSGQLPTVPTTVPPQPAQQLLPPPGVHLS